MDSDILALHTLLDVDNPVDLGPATSSWTIDALKKAGWEEGDKIPGGCPAFFGEVFRILQAPPVPESVLAVMEHPDVLFVFQSAVKVVREKQHVQDTVQAKMPEMFDTSVTMTPAIQAIRNAAVEAETRRVMEAAAVEEDLSDLEEPETEVAEAAPQTPAIAHCPCCQWDLTQPYNSMELTEDEVRRYLIYVMGGPAYTHTFSLWGGLGEVTFAATTGEDEDLFMEQLARDYALGRAELPAAEARRCDRYRVVLSLKSITFNSGTSSRHIQAPGVWQDPYAPTQELSRLERYINNWYTKQISSVELHNMLVVLWQDFSRRIGLLRRELYRPDFWTGVSLD